MTGTAAMTGARLTGIRFDALDAPALERFWTAATRGRTGGLRLRFDPTDRPKTSKNRLHLDLAGGPDWPAELERLHGLGATPLDIGQGSVPWEVLADPEGNEFCLLHTDFPPQCAGAELAGICLDATAESLQRLGEFWRVTAGWDRVDQLEGAIRLRAPDAEAPSLVMGPPAAPKAGRNRARLEVLAPDGRSGEYLDPDGNEFHALAPD